MHLSTLRAGELEPAPGNFNALVENAIHSIWNEFKNLFLSNAIMAGCPWCSAMSCACKPQLPTCWSTLVQTFQDRAELKLVTRADWQANTALSADHPCQSEPKRTTCNRIPRAGEESELRLPFGSGDFNRHRAPGTVFTARGNPVSFSISTFRFQQPIELKAGPALRQSVTSTSSLSPAVGG